MLMYKCVYSVTKQYQCTILYRMFFRSTTFSKGLNHDTLKYCPSSCSNGRDGDCRPHPRRFEAREALREQHQREIAHVAKAQSDLAKTEEALERCTAARALAGAGVDAVASASAAPSPGSAGANGSVNRGGSRAARDARLLKSTDIPSIAERVLELELLEPTVERAVGDALACAKEWEERAEAAKEALARAEQELADTPASERDNLVAIVEAVSEQRSVKRRLQAAMEDIRRAHGDKLHMRKYEVDQLRDVCSAVDVKLGQVRADVRLLNREQHSYTARIETMEEQRADYRERLREFVGDDDLLRVSFNRYDTDQSGSLNAKEIYSATQEVLSISDEQAAESFTLQDAQDQVEAYDRDGNGSLNFREFRKMPESL